MKSTYSVSDIIFGTRYQYIELQRKLKLLEALTDISKNKQVGDISYRIKVDRSRSKTDDNIEIIPELEYVLVQNPNTLRGIIEYLRGQIFGYPLPPYYNEGAVLQDKDGNYYFETNEVKNDIYIENQEKYKEIVNEISNQICCFRIKSEW